MTLFNEYQRLKTEQKIADEKRYFNVKQQQYDNLQRQSNTTSNRDYCRLTSNLSLVQIF